MIGDSFSYPFYDAEDPGVKLGYYVDYSVFTTPNEFSDENATTAFAGMYTGTFNFDYNSEFERYTSQILVQGYLNNANGMIAITGGLGEYGCAAGNVYINDLIFDEETGDEEPIGDGLQFIICNACSS